MEKRDLVDEPTAIPADCATRTVIEHVTSKWGLLVILALSKGTLRWSQLLKVVDGVSEKMLGQTLRVLADDGFVSRNQHPTMPPHVEYSLTDSGREVAIPLAELVERVVEHESEAMLWSADH